MPTFNTSPGHHDGTLTGRTTRPVIFTERATGTVCDGIRKPAGTLVYVTCLKPGRGIFRIRIPGTLLEQDVPDVRGGTGVSGEWDDPLGALQFHWGEAYAISQPAPDVWLAQRRDSHKTLRDQTPMGLRGRIVADYTARPISRDVMPPGPEE